LAAYAAFAQEPAKGSPLFGLSDERRGHVNGSLKGDAYRLSSVLIDSELHQRAGVYIQPHPRSSMTMSEAEGPSPWSLMDAPRSGFRPEPRSKVTVRWTSGKFGLGRVSVVMVITRRVLFFP
jgi:hypothetical protein